MAKLTLTASLSKVKMLDKRITRAIEELVPVAVVQGKKAPRNFKSIPEFNETVISKWQSINDMVNERRKLKDKIIEVNANTTVTILGKEMTIASMIERKNSIKYEKQLLNQLKHHFAKTENEVIQQNLVVNNQLNKLLESYFGKDSDKKIDKNEQESITKPFLENNEYKTLDPLSIREKIDSLVAYVDELEENVDQEMSILNAMTTFEID